jgi:predicted transcriptional regulator
MRSITEIRSILRTHQLRLKLGDELPFMTDIANRAGIHRDTVYSVLQGNRINERTQYALSRVLEEIQEECKNKPQTKLMNISLTSGGVKLGFGVGSNKLRV